MIVVGNVPSSVLNAARGSLVVIIEAAATCSMCGGAIAAKEQAVFAWDNKRTAQPSRAHIDGQGTTEIRHRLCPVAPPGYKPTSYEAWVASLPNLRGTEKVILDLYHRHGQMTDEQLYEAYGALDSSAYRNTVLPARTGLVKAGLVKDTGQKRNVRSGRRAIVWGLAI